MKRKNLFTSAVIIASLTLSIGACLSGCGKQEEIVNAATIETLTSEVTTEEESSTETTGEESVAIVEPTTTATTDDDNLGVDGEFADGEYNELDEKETDKTVDETANTNETDNDATADLAADLGLKTVVIDGEVYIDISGDDDDGYVPPTGGDTTPLPPELGPNGSGNDDQGPEFGSNTNAPVGHYTQ